jgi:hypothetical protein
MFTALTVAEIAQGKFIHADLMSKIKDNLDYLYGMASGGQGPQVINGSFDIDSDSDGLPDSWACTPYTGGTIALETTSPDHGAKSLKFVHPGGVLNGGGNALSDYIEVSELLTYTLNFIHWASAAGMKNKVQLSYYTKAKVELGAGSPVSLYDSTANPTSPTAYTYQFTPPATTRYIKIRVIGGFTDTNVAGSAYFDNIRVASAIQTADIVNAVITEVKMAAAAISQAKLKTSTGEVSTDSTSGANLTLPGGEYGFYPQIKSPNGVGLTAYVAGLFVGTSYTTNIHIIMASACTGYAQQRYVTSSGEVNWLFFLRDKTTKKIKASWICSDHPCFGNGGDPESIQHPFIDFSSVTEEIVCINPTDKELADIKSNIPKGKSILQVINEDYKIDDSITEQWPTKEITTGLPEGYDWKMAKNGDDLAPIKSTIPKPDYILCKKLIPLKI